MLSETACLVLSLIGFWLMQMEVGVCEGMFAPWDGRSKSKTYYAVWPRLPCKAARAFLPDLAHRWTYDAAARHGLARLGLLLGAAAVAGPRLRVAAYPAFLTATRYAYSPPVSTALSTR